MKRTANLGQLGEDLACQYLLQHHYRILERNYHSRYGEIDIIAQKDMDIIFIEIKTRKNSYFYAPLEAVTIHKQKKLILTAEQYITLNYSEQNNYRFDVIEIIFKDAKNYTINHLKGAFEV